MKIFKGFVVSLVISALIVGSIGLFHANEQFNSGENSTIAMGTTDYDPDPGKH